MNKDIFRTHISSELDKAFFGDNHPERTSQVEYQTNLVKNDIESCAVLKNHISNVGDFIAGGTYGKVYDFGRDLVLKFQTFDDYVDYSRLRDSNASKSKSETMDKLYANRFGVQGRIPYARIPLDDIVDYGVIPFIKPYNDPQQRVVYSSENTFFFRNSQNCEYAINYVLLSAYGPELVVV